jgi:3-methyladenine DNA glycosylase AlkD
MHEDNYRNLMEELRSLADSTRARNLARFFRTGKGEYGEGDKFLGIIVPLQRKVAKKYHNLKLEDIQIILRSEYHEFRLTGLLILVEKFEKGDDKIKKRIYKFYLKNLKHINNWDLVDVITPKIVGAYLANKPLERKILYVLARSKDLWKKRIAIIATHSFIRTGDFSDTLKISKILLGDKHDLIHKAVGWSLREVGKKNKKIEEIFLSQNCCKMPRVMLRYAIEKFSKKRRDFYMKK